MTFKVTEGGATDTDTAFRVTVAVADFVVSATLVAVIVMVWVDLMVAGAVYCPLAESMPTEGFMLQVTAVLLVPVTVAVYCC